MVIFITVSECDTFFQLHYDVLLQLVQFVHQFSGLKILSPLFTHLYATLLSHELPHPSFCGQSSSDPKLLTFMKTIWCSNQLKAGVRLIAFQRYL